MALWIGGGVALSYTPSFLGFISQELAIQGQAQTQHEATHTYIHLYLQLIHMRAYAAARVSEIGRLG